MSSTLSLKGRRKEGYRRKRKGQEEKKRVELHLLHLEGKFWVSIWSLSIIIQTEF
jgi:hypothetical protein